MAVIFCNTGIALLAYMDGIAGRSPTLGGVVLAAAASAGSAVYKVFFLNLKLLKIDVIIVEFFRYHLRRFLAMQRTARCRFFAR